MDIRWRTRQMMKLSLYTSHDLDFAHRGPLTDGVEFNHWVNHNNGASRDKPTHSGGASVDGRGHAVVGGAGTVKMGNKNPGRGETGW